MPTKKMFELAQARLDTERVKRAVDQAQEKLEQTYEFADLRRLKGKLDEAMDEEARIRGPVELEAMEEFGRTGDKSGYEGAKIKAMKVVNLVDIGRATRWCKENAKALIVLDQKSYIKHVKAGLPGAPDEVVEEYKVYLDKDLTRFAEGPDAS